MQKDEEKDVVRPSGGGAADPLNQSGLDAAIAQAEGLTQANYSPETWEALQTAVQAGKDLKIAIAGQESGGSTEGPNYVVNGDFEVDGAWTPDQLTGWTIESGSTTVVGGEGVDGSQCFRGEELVSQELTGLEDGNYRLTAVVMHWGSGRVYAQVSGMTVADSDMVNLNGGTQNVSLSVTVTGGSCTIYLENQGANMDNVALMKAVEVADPIEQADVDEAAQVIVDAIAALEPGKGEPDEQGLYWNMLNVYLEQAALVATDYTTESWAKLQEAVDAAALIEKAAEQAASGGSVGPVDYVTNGSFENDLEGWTATDVNGNTAVKTIDSDPQDGTKALDTGKVDEGNNHRQFTISQTFEVPAGTYTLSGWVRGAVKKGNISPEGEQYTKLTVDCEGEKQEFAFANQG